MFSIIIYLYNSPTGTRTVQTITTSVVNEHESKNSLKKYNSAWLIFNWLRFGAEEARQAHNLEDVRSKLTIAIIFFLLISFSRYILIGQILRTVSDWKSFNGQILKKG
jgi:hypothetical protein